MSKEQNSKQMSLLEDSHANHSALQENKKEQTTTAISGQKCLDSLKKLNQNSLLGRMCKELLTSKTAWYSDRCSTTWKVKVSKSNVSLFQLRGIGAWHQRNRTWIIGHSKHNGLLASEKRSRDKKINGGTSKGQNQTIESERTNGSTNDGNVSNTNNGRTEIQTTREQSSIEMLGSSSKEGRSENDVSNSISSLRGRWGTIGQSGEDQIWRFRSKEEEQTTHDIRSQTIRRNALSREGEEDVSHSNEIGLQGRSIQSDNMQRRI